VGSLVNFMSLIRFRQVPLGGQGFGMRRSGAVWCSPVGCGLVWCGSGRYGGFRPLFT
jgi:hypothetical protein